MMRLKFNTLLPADTYTVINRSVITAEDRKNIISLYEPIIGPIAVCLYFTFLRDINLRDIISTDYTHHHLTKMLKTDLDTIKQAKASLEGVGLIKTYYKEGEPNSYVYELFSPLSPKEFLANPIFNVTLYNNVGKLEYDLIKSEFEIPKIDLKDYEDISAPLNKVYKSSPDLEIVDSKERRTNSIKIESNINYDLIKSSLPQDTIKNNIFTKKTKELIDQLSLIYDLDTLKMIEIIRLTLTEKGTINKEDLRKEARKYYQYKNNGKLPTLVYRKQPEYLKSPVGDKSPRAQIVYMFENTTPYDFLKLKNNGASPTSHDLKIIENLMVDLSLPPGVVNVLIDYVLKKNENKLSKPYVDAIASQWKRCHIETAEDAMEQAKKENQKYNKKIPTKSTKKDEVPIWFNQEIKKEEMSEEDQKDIDSMFKRFGD